VLLQTPHGKLTSQHGILYDYIYKSFGIKAAKDYLDSNENAISSIKKIVDTEQINCDFEHQNSFIFTNDKNELEKMHSEINILNTLNFPAFFSKDIPLPIPSLGSICFPNQAQFHPRKYCLGLLNTLPKNSVFENTKAIDIKKNGNKYKTICDNGYTVTSSYVAITSHYPVINFPGFYFLKMYQDKSYLIAVDTKSELFSGMYISSKDPVTSFRTALINGKRLLLIGGSGHKTGNKNTDTSSCYTNLEQYAKNIYPNSETLYKWSTQDCVTLDKIPYIGQFSSLWPNVYVATGYKKWGMTTSYVAANTIFHEIINKPLESSKIYKATRFQPLKNKSETMNIIKQTGSSLIVDKLKKPTLTIDDLNVGDGGIVSYNGEKIGVYKKSNDEIIAIKPYCTHLGCELTWNNQEKTWDCPCHGSRFTYNGKVLNEPAIEELEKI